MRKTAYDKFNGREVYLYTLKNDNIEVDVCEIGARINAIRVNGIDIVLGFNSDENYIASGTFAGATIGRVANRIAGGRFVLNDRPYFLNKNVGNNHLHGGNIGFDKQRFLVLPDKKEVLLMQYVSEHNEERYPGTLKLNVKYSLCDNELLIEYEAVSDRDTLWCPTNHAYFNLDGENSGDCRNNLLQINSDFYIPVDSELIPTGEKRAVEGTPFNFTKLKRIGESIESEELKATLGYDHNYILASDHAAHAESEITGIKMDVFTDMPCLQFYSGGALKSCIGKSRRYDKWAGYCLEPQFCPNAINMQDFEKPIIKKGKIQTHYIKFAF